MGLRIAIVGRANVGKSTLFNKLVGRKLALVDDRPGVTRDVREVPVSLNGRDFLLLDTAGIEAADKDSLTDRMAQNALAAARKADVVLLMIDGREGVLPADEIVAGSLRKFSRPVILIANKCEARAAQATAHEAWRLGFGEPVLVSAEHGLGFADLIEALDPHLESKRDEEDAEEVAETPLKLAIIGRPNVGKSSLFNRLIGEERALTGPEAGITRDAITMPWNIEGRQVLLHDTAGLRKKARAREDRLERMSVGATMEALRFCDCAIVMLDATQAFEKQDLTIADLVAREGRAVVYAVNKWDLIDNPAGAVGRFRELADAMLPQIPGVPLVGISALTGQGVERLPDAITAADKAWNTRVPTAALNRFLEEALARHAPPAVSGRRIRIRYMTQVKARPPSFALFGNQLDSLPDSYQRYLIGGIRKCFDLAGTPVRLMMRSRKNPYAD